MQDRSETARSRRDFLHTAVAGAGLLLGGTAVRALGRESPDTLYLNGDVITQDPLRPRATAFAVHNGLFAAVGADREIAALRGAGTTVIDLHGRTVIPGLNDSHMHPTRAGRFFASELRWDGVPSLAIGLRRIREQALRTPAGQWVRVVGGWSPQQFDERRLPTPAELTDAAPETPVYVLFLYSRGFLNRAAVEALGLRRDAPAPPGTRYEFTADGGAILHAEPNLDLLYGTIAALPALTDAEQRLSTRHFYRELNRFGITSVIDAGGGGHRYPEHYAASAALAAEGALTLRISQYLFPQDKGAELAEFERWIRTAPLGVNTAHELMDGFRVHGAGEFLVWSAGDYENFLAPAPDIRRRPGWRRDLLDVTRRLLEHAWPIRIHATYDASVRAILDVFEEAHALEVEAGRRGFAAVRLVFDHGETLQPDTLARLRMLGAGLAMQSRMAYAGEYFLERYGEVATRRAPPLQDVLRAGIPLGLGSDATRVASYNPWITLYWASTGRSVGGTVLHGPDQRLSREQALFQHTVGSAWVSQEERLKGRIRAGQYADFAVLTAPYLDVGNDALRGIESSLTVVGGQPVYSDGSDDVAVGPLPPIEPDWSPVARYGGYFSGE